MVLKDKPEYMRPVIETIRYGEVSMRRHEIYDFIFTKTYPVSQMVLNQQSEDEFIQNLYDNIKSAAPKYTQHLEEAYNYAVQYLPHKGEAVVICDVGWGGTVQAVFSQFAELHGRRNAVEGLYIGCHAPTRFPIHSIPMTGYLMPDVMNKKYRSLWNAVIWEYVYTNKVQFFEDTARLNHIATGSKIGHNYFKDIHIDPVSFFNEVVSAQIERLLTKPTDAEIRTLGSIRFDTGFNDTNTLHIIDLNYSRLGMYKRLLLHPKATLKLIVTPNVWTHGYIRYYRLYGVTYILRIVGFIKHTRYI